MHPHELLALTIVEADRRIAAGDLSPVELTQACLSRIEETEPKINAFITLLADQALAQARESEERARRGERRGPLDGIPVAVKDLYETAGVRTTAASNILRDHVPERDSFAVARLKDAGAVLLGKLNMHEWAWGGTSIVSAFGPVRNPWDLERIAGGSSGGSAAGLAASQFLGSLGTDTGGSIRIPASLCGIVGLKPTFGRVSVRGVLPMAESLDHAGPMARCVEDVAIILQAIAGYDPDDPATFDAPLPDYRRACQSGLQGMKVGVPRAMFVDADPRVLQEFEAALDVLRSLGAEVRDIDIPGVEASLGAWFPITAGEVAAYHRQWLAERPQDYQPGLLPLLQACAEVKAGEYVAAKRVQQEVKRAVALAFAEVDILATPTTPCTATLIADEVAGRGKQFTIHRFTQLFNMTGLPAISVPCGLDLHGLPVGLQLAGMALAEPAVLHIAYAYEQATQWHVARPQL